METLTAASKNGQAQKSPTKKTVSAAQKRADELSKKFENFGKLQEEVKKRRIFQGKLELIEESRTELKESPSENWEDQETNRIQLVGRYGKAILTIGTKEIVDDILDIIQEKIEKKIQAIDEVILAATV